MGKKLPGGSGPSAGAARTFFPQVFLLEDRRWRSDEFGCRGGLFVSFCISFQHISSFPCGKVISWQRRIAVCAPFRRSEVRPVNPNEDCCGETWALYSDCRMRVCTLP
jgi:hypothetical protein